ncbi:MAG: peptidyl-prolyl cis-trans isomerase [Lachnospiraceae bacterium]|nr:peptidyl-prolyl cis-trans isomerase [Lachnospiraceae bacterium]
MRRQIAGKWKKQAALLGLAAALSFGAAACGGEEDPENSSRELSDQEVFSINGKSCTLAQAKIFLTNYQNLYGTAYGVNLWEHDFGDNSLEKYVKDLSISQMAQIMSMDFLAEQEEVALTQEENERIEEAAEAYYASLNEAELSYMGISQGDVEEVYRQYGLANKLYQYLTSSISDEVSDDEARVMEVQRIFVTSKEAADEVMARLASGSDFMNVAATYNESGQVEINLSRGQLPQEVEEVVFALLPEELTECIQAEDGYYVIKCINNYNQELTDASKQMILEKRRKEAFEDVYEDFIAQLPSVFNEELWESVELVNSEEISTSNFFEIYESYCD